MAFKAKASISVCQPRPVKSRDLLKDIYSGFWGLTYPEILRVLKDGFDLHKLPSVFSEQISTLKYTPNL